MCFFTAVIMPQKYIKELEDGFVVLWKTDESLESCRQSARQSGIIFPRGWNGWKNETKQKQALIARQVCMDRLGQPEIFYEQNGKPFLSCGRLSISHSQQYLALYFHNRQEIGVDVEEPHERIRKIAHRFLHTDEKTRDYTVIELTAIWAIKESIFKKFGGKTAFFSENIVAPIPALQPGNNQSEVIVHTETGTIRQWVDIICENEYILASTR